MEKRAKVCLEGESGHADLSGVIQLDKMTSDCDGSLLKSDGSLNQSSDFTSDTSFSEDRYSNSWNLGNDSREDASDISDIDRLKRGRPRADQINSLMVKGAQRESSIRCKICRRVFPREKSLQAHMRTHTGEAIMFHLKG